MSSDSNHIKDATTTHHQPVPSDDCQLQVECQQLLNLAGAYQKVAGTGMALKDIAAGGVHEVTNHPIHLAEQAAMGAGLTVAAKLLPREPVVFTGVFMAGLALIKLSVSSRDWLHAAAVLTGSEAATSEATKTAHVQLRGLGAGLADAAAATVGGGLTFKGLSRMEARAVLNSDATKPYASSPDPDSFRFKFQDSSRYPGAPHKQFAPTERIWGRSESVAPKHSTNIEEIWRSEPNTVGGR